MGLYVFLGLLVAMSIQQLPNLKLYWTRDRGPQFVLVSPNFGRFMARFRFESLLACLSFSDKDLEIPYGEEGHDKLYKIRGVVRLLNQAWSECWRFG